ncbi:MAG: hypothetical protein M1830_003940 [Pleopsidium flavum]|nr:MAG: hypothetical protein M1830_003940 [Pleopsidium flavum]
MSSTAVPISPERFAIAIADLPLASLHLKASELRNSIRHLQYSNWELRRFAEEGDQDCLDAIRENREVIRRVYERILLLRREVERRGFMWGDSEVDEKEEMDGDVERANGEGAQVNGGASVNGVANGRAGNGEGEGGSLTDDELARRLREQMEQDNDGDGVHL